jgi:transketolase
MLATPGCICLAVGRSKLNTVTGPDGKPLFAGDYKFEYGKAVKLRQGRDGSIFALGAMAQTALEAAELLAKEGVNVTVWAVSCPLEVDLEALKEAAQGPILTVEDHHVDTGMGAIMALTAAREGLKLGKFRTLGVSRYGASGSSADVYADMGLSASGIAAAFREN